MLSKAYFAIFNAVFFSTLSSAEKSSMITALSISE
jgi:hypothetical protein